MLVGVTVGKTSDDSPAQMPVADSVQREPRRQPSARLLAARPSPDTGRCCPAPRLRLAMTQSFPTPQPGHAPAPRGRLTASTRPHRPLRRRRLGAGRRWSSGRPSWQSRFPHGLWGGRRLRRPSVSGLTVATRAAHLILRHRGASRHPDANAQRGRCPRRRGAGHPSGTRCGTAPQIPLSRATALEGACYSRPSGRIYLAELKARCAGSARLPCPGPARPPPPQRRGGCRLRGRRSRRGTK